MTITTPALLFPAISLLLLAYTNRFLVLAQLIRQLHGKNREDTKSILVRQIDNLKRRINLIRSMQAFGIFSFLLCTISMFAVFMDQPKVGEYFFGASLIMLSLSLLFSLREIQISCQAIEIELEDLEQTRVESTASHEPTEDPTPSPRAS